MTDKNPLIGKKLLEYKYKTKKDGLDHFHILTFEDDIKLIFYFEASEGTVKLKTSESTYDVTYSIISDLGLWEINE